LNENTRGTLYLCATPIGNLEDITLRALRVLREVDLIAAEDTRHTRKLLSHYDIHTPLTSFHRHNLKKKGAHLLELLVAGKNIALVSDAGLPGIADPGPELVTAALERGCGVVPVPGPSAGITALVASGLSTESFVFIGFLPAAERVRIKKLKEIRHQRGTLIFYEAPHRLRGALTDIIEVLGNRPAAAARELTKMHEEIIRGTMEEIRARFGEEEPRGEFTLVVAGDAGEEDTRDEGADEWLHLDPVAHVARLEAEGIRRKEAIREVARLRGIPRREVYRAVVEGRTP